MPSITTQSIGPAVSAIAQSQASQQRDRATAQPPNAAQLAQATQVASQQIASQLKSDQDRKIQIPKKVEANFQSSKERDAAADEHSPSPEVLEPESHEPPKKVNFVA